MAAVPETDQNPLLRSAIEVKNLLSEVTGSLRFYVEAGYSGGECSPANLERIRRWGDPDCLRADGPVTDISTDIPACEGCPLRAGATHSIAGAGPAGAKLMFVIGYPSFSTAKERNLYAGGAGQLLVRIISAMNLTPDDVYVSHIVKCRPSDGKEPSAEETRRCLLSLEGEIKAVGPEVICTLGEFVARSFLDSSEPLEGLRGRFHERDGVTVMPTWHPDDIIDDPAKKRPVWEDVRKVMARLDGFVNRG
jgi:DNA polymerase